MAEEYTNTVIPAKAGIYRKENVMDAVSRIANEIRNAEKGKQVATIHYQALSNAEELEGIDLGIFCKEANIAESYSTEIRKMISLKKFMKEIGANITCNSNS